MSESPCITNARRTGALLAALLLACGGDDGPTDPDPSPSLAVSLSASTVELVRGGAASVVVTVSRRGGFAGPVLLLVEGLPVGVTTSTTVTVPAADASATLTFAASGTATIGTSTVTVRASAPGAGEAVATLALSVSEAPGGGSFTLSLIPATVSLERGRSAVVAVGVARAGPFGGVVTLSVSGAPDGVGVVFDPPAVAGGQGTLTLVASADAATGPATLTVRGTGVGAADQEVALALTVVPATSGSLHSWLFCGPVPDFFAVKNGAAAWTAVPATGSAFTFPADSSRIGVAYTTLFGASAVTSVFYMAGDEVEGVRSFCPGWRSVEVTTSGLGAADGALISLGSATSVVSAGQGGAVLAGVTAGPVDLLGARVSHDPFGRATVDRFLLRRGLDPAHGATVVADFDGPAAFAPDSAMVTMTGLAGSSTLMILTYLTAGNQGFLLDESAFQPGASRPLPGVPAARQEAGDLHGLSVSMEPVGGESRGAWASFHALADIDLPFGPPLGPTDFSTGAAGPVARPRLRYARQQAYADHWFLSYSQGGDRLASISLQATAAYQGAADIDLIVPDFSGLPGWDDAWGLQSGMETHFGFSAMTWSVGDVTTLSGRAGMSAGRSGTIVP